MANEKKDIDLVKEISERYHDLSLTLAGMIPSDPGYNDLEQKRAELGVRLDRLVREFIRNSTERFVNPSSEIARVNSEAKKALRKLQSMKDAIDAVTRLINTIDGFIAAVFPLPV